MHKKQIRPLARLHGYWIYRRVLSETSDWPVEKRKAYVFERLQQTLIRAEEGIPFYRERFRKAGFNPRKDFRRLGDLAQLPLLTKTEVRTHHQEIVDRRFLNPIVVANT